MFKLREYQQDCVDTIISHLKKSIDPVVIEAATGSGKSLMVAELARWLNGIAPKKKVLCFAPSKELIEQNYAKYRLTGNDASIFCASAGGKCLRNPVIFCSPLTTNNAINEIARMEVSAIILDEAHTLTPTILSIIDAVKSNNPNCRIIGMTATPYRMGSGFIYELDTWGEDVQEKAKDPFFKRLAYRITAPDLIEQGHLTPPRLIDSKLNYNTSNLKKNSMGNFESDDLRAAFEGQSITKKIIDAIILESDECFGVMIFATTVDHAKEILSMLPDGDCRMVTGMTPGKERAETTSMFKAKMFKFLVNVSCLTTGFDAPHVDFIAVLRPTESRGLFQQIIGRGTRLSKDKPYFNVIDCAGNIKRHGLSPDNLFNPEIQDIKELKEAREENVTCPICGFININKIIKKNGKFMSTLRRCSNITPIEGIERPILQRHFYRCTHYFKFRMCPKCESENDIAARKCKKCNQILIDPNNKLSIGNDDGEEVKIFEHKVTSFVIMPHRSKAGHDGFKALINNRYIKYFATHTKKGMAEYLKASKLAPTDIVIETSGKYPDIYLEWR